MPDHQSIELGFPLGGVHRGFALDNQPPNTALDAQNVRPEGPFERRDRGGTRPPLSYKYTGLGGTMECVNTAAGAPTYDTATGLSTVNVDSIPLTGSDPLTTSVYQDNNRTKITIEVAEFSASPSVVGWSLHDTTLNRSHIITIRSTTTIAYVRGNASDFSGAGTIFPFNAAMVGGWIRFPSGNSFQIAAYVDGNTVTVDGIASGEATGTLTIGNEAVNMLASVRRALDVDATGGDRYWEDLFDSYNAGTMGTENGWSIPTWASPTTGYYPLGYQDNAVWKNTYTSTATGTWTIMERDLYVPQPAIDKKQVILIDMHTLLFDAQSKDFLATVFFRLNDETPDGTADGCRIDLTFEWDEGKVRCITRQYAGSSLIETISQSDASRFNYSTGSNRGVFRFEYGADDKTINVSYNSTLIFSVQFAATLAAAGGAAGTRWAAGFQWSGTGTETQNAVAFLHGFAYFYTSEDTVAVGGNRNQLVAAAGGLLYTNTTDESQLAPLSTTLTLAADRPILATEYLQKIYIADTSPLVASGSSATSTCVITAGSAADCILQDDDYDNDDPDWTELGLNANDFVVVISTIATGGNEGVYQIASIAAGGLTLSARSDSTKANPTAGSLNVTYTIVRGVKIYDPSAGTLTLAQEQDIDSLHLQGGGLGFPQNCTIVVNFQDRLIWAGNLSSPYEWYASYRGAVAEYFYTNNPDDPYQATVGQDGAAGSIGDDIMALAVVSSDYLVFGGRKSIWVMRGDPGIGVVIDNVSRVLGIVGNQAFCPTPEGGLLFMSQDGVGYLSPGINAVPELVSRDRLPEDMAGVDNQLTECVMQFDTEFRGAHIYLTPKYESGSNLATAPIAKHFWLSWEHKSYWPVVIPASAQPISIISYSPATSGSHIVLLGGRNGGVMQYKWGGYDVESSIESFIILGPIPLAASGDMQGILASFEMETASRSGTLTWELYVGATAQLAAIAAETGTTPDATASQDNGIQYRSYPRLRGGFACIKLMKTSATGSNPDWALENIYLGVVPAGKRRK